MQRKLLILLAALLVWSSADGEYFKNVASQSLYVYAYDKTTGLGKTGDGANFTIEISKDGGAQAGLNDGTATEIGDGWYLYALTQPETNADIIAISGSSTTGNVLIQPVHIITAVGDTYTRVGAPAGASTAADIAALKAETTAILEDTGTTLPTTLSGLATAVNLATVDTVVDSILEDTGTTLPTTLSGLATAVNLATVDTVVDSILVDTGTTLPATLATLADSSPLLLRDTTAATVTDQTHLTLTAGSNVDSAYVNQVVVLYDASNSNYPSVRRCTAYTGATKTMTLNAAPVFTLIAGDGVKIFVVRDPVITIGG